MFFSLGWFNQKHIIHSLQSYIHNSTNFHSVHNWLSQELAPSAVCCHIQKQTMQPMYVLGANTVYALHLWTSKQHYIFLFKNTSLKAQPGNSIVSLRAVFRFMCQNQHGFQAGFLNDYFPVTLFWTLKVYWHLWGSEWTEDWGFVIKWTRKTCRWWRERHWKGLRTKTSTEAALAEVPLCTALVTLRNYSYWVVRCNCTNISSIYRWYENASGGTSAKATTAKDSFHPNYKHVFYIL